MPVNKPAIDELCQKVDCRYTLVVESSKRARELVGGSQPLVDPKDMKPVSIAVDEINRGLLAYRRNLEDENGHLIAPDKLFTVSHYNVGDYDVCPVAYSGGEVTAYSPETVAIVSSGSMTTAYSGFGCAVSAANSA